MTTSNLKAAAINEVISLPHEITTAPKLKDAPTSDGELVPTAVERFEEHHGTFAEFHHGYVSQYITLADTKAAWAFAVTSGALAFLLSDMQLRNLLLQPSWTPTYVLLATVLVLLLTSSLCAFLVIAPRFTTSGEGLVFYKHVAARTDARAYARAIASKSVSELTYARLKHTYDLSRVCTKKYDYLAKAMWLGLPALGGAGLVLLQRS